MHFVSAPQCSANATHCPSVTFRSRKVCSLSANRGSSLRKQQSLLRHKSSRPAPICSAAESGVLESVNQSAGVIPQAAGRLSHSGSEDWDLALQYMKDGSVHEVEVHQVNKGGLRAMICGIESFVPYSKVYKMHMDESVEKYYEAKSIRESIKMKVKIVAVDMEKRQCLLSEKAAFMDAAMEKIKPGDVVTAVVRSLAQYGAFTIIRDPQTGDLSGGNALLHNNDLSWDRIRSPSEVVSVGDEIQCKVKTVDKEKKQIALSLKLMETEA